MDSMGKIRRNPADPRHIEQSTIDIINYNKPVTGLGEKEAAIIALDAKHLVKGTVLRNLCGGSGSIRPQRHRRFARTMAGYSGDSAELTAFDQQLQIGQKPFLPSR